MATAALSTNQQTHLVVTYSMDIGAARLYVNGQRVASGAATIPLNTINDINNWLGRSQWNDPFFTGQYNEFRIYEGALTEEQVAAQCGAGPDTLGANSGDLQTLRLVVSTNSLTPGGLERHGDGLCRLRQCDERQCDHAADDAILVRAIQHRYSQRERASIEAVAAGSADDPRRLRRQGRPSAAVTVNASTAPPPKLIHRYSFTRRRRKHDDQGFCRLSEWHAQRHRNAWWRQTGPRWHG